MDECLRFQNAIFCSSNCIFFRFSAHNLSLLLIFYFFRSSVIRTVNINYLAPKFNVMFRFNYLKYNPRGLYMERIFRFKSWFLNAPGLYTEGLIMGILRYINK